MIAMAFGGVVATTSSLLAIYYKNNKISVRCLPWISVLSGIFVILAGAWSAIEQSISTEQIIQLSQKNAELSEENLKFFKGDSSF